tara:strand:- start:27203 stop:27763 length:561 start_codon:yes stop_codon:yes gene_type:complete
MEQKTWDILDILRLERNHPREMAKQVGTNHTKIIRNLKILYENNIVDFKREGKNKVYYLKDNLITRKKVLSLEYYKFERLAKAYPKLVPVISEMLEIVKKETVILFGSYAKFRVKEGSDIDVYVDSEDRNLRKKIEDINSKLSVKIGKFDKKSPLGKEIIRNHIILKGVEEFYEKYKIFEEVAFGE